MWPRYRVVIAISLLVQSGTAQRISPISAKGSKLYDEDGKQFYVKGVAYGRALTADALANTNQCQVDAGMMRTLGANVIIVYTVDSSKHHDGCMQAFANQGIYVWLNLGTPKLTINRVDPQWTIELFNGFAATMDAFALYDNLLAFTVGNEIINDGKSARLLQIEYAPNAHTGKTTPSASYIKAAARDMKAYRDARGYRKIPIGYSSADVTELRKTTAEYLACGQNESTSIDVIGMNVYSWCGNSSYYTAGYDTLYEEFQNLNIPVLFTETGCNSVEPRDFSDVSTMLGPIFQAVFSGAIVYEWTETDSGYGLVNYSNADYTGFPTTLDDFNNLQTVFSTISPKGTSRASYTPSNSVPACPTTNKVWSVPGDAKLPTIANLNLQTVTPYTTLTTSSSPGSGTVSARPPSATALGESGDSAGKPGVSTGAKVGIALGVAGGAIAIIAAAVSLLWRRRKRRAAQAARLKPKNHDDNENRSDSEKPELAAQSAKAFTPKSELDAVLAAHHLQRQYPFPHRLPADLNAAVNELGNVGVAELGGNTPATAELGGREESRRSILDNS